MIKQYIKQKKPHHPCRDSEVINFVTITSCVVTNLMITMKWNIGDLPRVELGAILRESNTVYVVSIPKPHVKTYSQYGIGLKRGLYSNLIPHAYAPVTICLLKGRYYV